MAAVDTAPLAQTQDTRPDRGPWLALAVAVFNVVAYVVMLVVPYYAAGAPDPSVPQSDGTTSPYPSAVGPLLTPLVFWVLGFAPFAAVVVAGWSGLRLWFTRDVSRGRAPLWAALVISVATLAWLVTDGAAILVWWID